MAQWHLDQLDFILEQYDGGIFQFCMCPAPLFADIIRINYLRIQAAQPGPSDRVCLSHEAFEIMNRVDNFSAEQWADCKPCAGEAWLIVGRAYKAAVTIYCISSLQSSAVLPMAAALRARCAAEGKILHQLLDSLSTAGIGLFMLWPLVTLGIEAANGASDLRRFVEQRLRGMSRQMGSYAPLMAQQVLERYWTSGERNWDSCFDRPYAFATQIAVDLTGLSPP